MSEEIKNSNCIKNNVLLRTEFVNEVGDKLEFLQAEPTIKATEDYHELNKELRTDDDYVEAEMLVDALLTEKELDKKIEYKKRINALNRSLDTKYDRNKNIRFLIKATLQGSDYQKGKVLLNGNESIYDLTLLPAKTYDKIMKNAIRLITIGIDEEKN